MTITNHLIEGESFSLADKTVTSQKQVSDFEINEKYKKGEIRIVTEQARYPLDTIASMLDSKQGDSNKYILNPEYQRRKRWDNVRKSRLIESFIMNVPIPPIFLYEIDYSIYEVMDGLQRLTAIYDFYRGKYELEGLEYWMELNGRKYENLPEQVRKGIDRRYLSSIVLLQETAKSKEEADYLKQIVFGRLNSGGEKLTPQETRNALYNGKFNQLCIRLAQNSTFRKTWHFPQEKEVEELLLKKEDELKDTSYSVSDIEAYRKMADVELVLRFFAYRHISELKGITVEKFLDEYLNKANQFSSSTIAQLENLFIDTITLVYEILGEEAFFLPKLETSEIEYKSPTKTIYDGLMQAFAKNIDKKKFLINNKNQIKANIYKDQGKLQRAKVKNKYLFDGRYNGRGDVQDRIDYYHTFLQDYIS
jgi:hypothetical protein